MQFGINKHEKIFSKTNKIALALRARDYVLIIYMKKYEIAYHRSPSNRLLLIIITQKQSARIKCKNNLFKPVHSVKTTAYD